jgi:hypothetical protein
MRHLPSVHAIKRSVIVVIAVAPDNSSDFFFRIPAIPMVVKISAAAREIDAIMMMMCCSYPNASRLDMRNARKTRMIATVCATTHNAPATINNTVALERTQSLLV